MKKPKESPPAAKTAAIKPDPPAPSPPPTHVKKEPPRRVEETKTAAPAKVESAPSFTSKSSVEGGGSEAGAGNLFSQEDVGVVPGTGTPGGAAATARLGRGSGTPALPVPLKTDREAKPLETVRPAYPPPALRMGREGDVVLKIVVDSEGKVMKAEIVKSAGMGFDEEALKAVKQSRFEPAKADGKNVPAEFTYIYRFRLRR